ncbi:MAG TPA: hypothetical protein VG276_08615 [Actinomycetes bacterium]|nr:hypothetical protein [Actinomycetes bacterium]
MTPTDPKHLADPRGPSPPVRNPVLMVAAGSLLVVVLAVAIAWAVRTSGSRPDRSPAGSQAATATSVATAPPTTAAKAGQQPGKEAEEHLIANPSFEASVAGWRPIGTAVLERIPTAKDGKWSVKLVGGQGSAAATRAGIEHAAVPVEPDVKVNQLYEAVVWVRTSKPGTLVQVNVVEYVDGRRFAVDSAGTDLRNTDWRQIEVYHYLHRPGSHLVVEVVAPALPRGESVLVDSVKMELEH